MTTYSKLNFVYRLQKWMDSVAGQTFLNYAYSWGASIVILGTLYSLSQRSTVRSTRRQTVWILTSTWPMKRVLSILS